MNVDAEAPGRVTAQCHSTPRRYHQAVELRLESQSMEPKKRAVGQETVHVEFVLVGVIFEDDTMFSVTRTYDLLDSAAQHGAAAHDGVLRATSHGVRRRRTSITTKW